jgi:hypothetical protein
MSEQINDGGPAFPVAEDHKIAADLDWTCGMSLRDYFAAQALPALVAVVSAGHHQTVVQEPIETVMARDCYRLADAMLRARTGAA